MLPLLSINCRATFAASCTQQDIFLLHADAMLQLTCRRCSQGEHAVLLRATWLRSGLIRAGFLASMQTAMHSLAMTLSCWDTAQW